MCGELSRSLHGRNQALSVCKIGLMENFNRSTARSFLGLARNRKVRKHGGEKDENDVLDELYKWNDLDYHGEVE